MKKSLRILVALSLAASSILFVPSATAAIGTLYSSSTGNGDVACTTGYFTIESNVVIGNSGCTGSADIPMGVLSIGQGAFRNSTYLTSVTISNSVTSIGTSAFDFVPRLATLTIGDHVTSIGTFAFFYASSLMSLTIPDSVTLIGAYSFYDAFALTTLTIGDGVTTIRSGAFSSSTSLSLLTIGKKVTTIESFAFSDATSLTSLKIPNNVTTIGDYAFSGSSSLTSLTIPNSVTSIGADTFSRTSSLSSYQYCGTALTSANLATAGLGSKTITGCAPVVTVPSAPTSVVATATGKRNATVSFAAPASNGGSAVTSYTATSTPGGLTQTLAQATGGSFNFDGLQPSTAYTFAVTATNAIGTSGAATSNSVTTTPLEVASLSALSFVDDGNGTSGKIVWAGMNVDRVLYTGPAQFYPGPFKYGAFTSGWNGLIRNLTPDTTYTVSINAHSADGVGGEKSLTFKTNVAPPALPGAINENMTGNLISDKTTGIVVVMGIPDPGREKLYEINTWLSKNTFVTGEASNMYGLLKKFFLLETSVSSTTINVPTSRVSNVVATSLTPTTCSVISATAAVDAGLVTALSTDKCTISYTVTGGSNAPATIVRDFIFTYFELKCGAGTYKLKAGFVSSGESCTGAVTIDATATSMANAAFVGSLITSITLPNSVTKIPDYAFAETYNLTKVELGNAVTSIGTGAFRSTGIVSILLPSSLRTLDNYVFLGSAITSLIIPVGTTTVGLSLFQSSLVFTTVTIPSTVTYMHPNALIYSGAKTINYCGNNTSVLRAIYNSSPWVKVSATCLAPATAPVTSSSSKP
jgi:hypothetical protein